MNQIKVRAGQVWVGNGINPRVTRFGKGAEINVESVTCRDVYYNEHFQLPIDMFYITFDFSPKTELEWLAVKLDKWYFSQEFAYWNGDAVFCSTIVNPGPYNASNEQKWQNMRYYLGLDKKPHYRLVDGEWVKQ